MPFISMFKNGINKKKAINAFVKESVILENGRRRFSNAPPDKDTVPTHVKINSITYL